MLKRQWLLFLGVVMLLSGVARSQTPQQSPGANPADGTPYRLRVTTQIVVMDVVVRDAANNPVRHLKTDDFSVTDAGVPQKILSFEAHDMERSAGVLPHAIGSTTDLDRTAPNSPVNIIVLDEISTAFEDEYFARYSLDRYLKSQGDTLSLPTMLMARTIGHLTVLSDYTTSRQTIMNTLNRHLVGGDWKNKDPNRRDEQAGAAFATLLEISKASQGHLGHKNLIWIGRGFPTISWLDLPPQTSDGLKKAVIQCANALRDSRITLYAIDPAGVTAPVETQNADNVVAPEDPFGGAVDFARMAEATGGMAIYGRNDVDKLIGQAALSGEVFYTLSFRPPQVADGDVPTFHQLKVSVRQPGLTASTREGYYAGGAQEDAKTGEALSNDSTFGLSAAASGILVFDGIPLQIARVPSGNSVSVAFPASALDLRDDGASLSGEVDLLVLGFDRSGKLISKMGKVVTLHVSGDDPQRTIHIAATVEALDRTARLRVVLRSHTNGKIGADNLNLVNMPLPATSGDQRTPR